MRRLNHLSKKAMIAVVVIVLAALVGMVAWTAPALFNRDSSTDSSRVVPMDEIEANVALFLEDGDTDGALEFYDEQVELRRDKEEKQLILIMKSRFAQGADKLDIAVDAAKKADSLNSTSRTLSALAEAYQTKGDKAQALKYYKEILKRFPQETETPIPGSRGPTLEDKIRELEQSS